ncbi:hypothetical protein M087_3024 [Bacteroides fragilis str. S23 R14]|nr:hypothetical protein M087_3024 [Bacteroides fragilis str. S23 R14]
MFLERDRNDCAQRGVNSSIAIIDNKLLIITVFIFSIF